MICILNARQQHRSEVKSRVFVMPNQIVDQRQEMLELWTFLPDDILMHIFQFLPAAVLTNIAQVRYAITLLLYVEDPDICICTSSSAYAYAYTYTYIMYV